MTDETDDRQLHMINEEADELIEKALRECAERGVSKDATDVLKWATGFTHKMEALHG